MSLQDYEVLRVIGRGTYGEVHLVVYKKDKKQYVIKKMALLKASTKERKAAEQEAKLLSDLRHPNIVSYKDSFESESGHLYIVMGFAEGGDLYTKLREHRDKKDYLTEQQTVRWYIQICMALQYLHERRILHRDLKTQNIFLTKSQMIKVGDLGIARVLDSATDMATTLIGTPYYMSPELFSNRPYNQKSDVWALGCCMYEMVTLKHAFNAKDINSLMYKILKGRMPTMPPEYSAPLCDLIKDMLHQNPDKRPSVNRILRNPFIKKHIKLFLDESSRRRRPASERSSRKSSVASSGAGSRPASARKASTNSQASSPSPHPPSIAPESSRVSRINQNLKSHQKPDSPIEHRETTENRNQSPKLFREKQAENSNEHHAQPCDNSPKDHNTNVTSNVKSDVSSSENQPKHHSPSPRVLTNVANSNTNNSHRILKQNDSGVYLNYGEVPQYEKVEIHREHKDESKPNIDISKQKEAEPRVNSASSTCSSSSRTSASSVTSRSRRPLPDCPAIKHSSGPKVKETESIDKSSEDRMQNSGESDVSTASTVTSSVANEDGTPRISSARMRRRERKRKEKTKTPAVIEEIRKSRNSGLKLGAPNKNNKNTKPVNAVVAKEDTKQKVYSDGVDGASGDGVPSKARSRENSGSQALGVISHQPESEEFITLLHTTLNLGSERETANGGEDVFEGGSPIMMDEEQRELSPVPELSESSSSSTVTNKSHPYSQNTPAATPISVPSSAPRKLYSDARQGISKGTLRSTQRLMDRIMSLRKDCIQSLGVPLLHQAYEVLDANENDDILQEELTKLLGPVRFEQWAGKIWQLKYCEESMFGHCGTITAF